MDENGLLVKGQVQIYRSKAPGVSPRALPRKRQGPIGGGTRAVRHIRTAW
jgi:hypothetical protein